MALRDWLEKLQKALRRSNPYKQTLGWKRHQTKKRKRARAKRKWTRTQKAKLRARAGKRRRR